jgi:hypothetical protein
VLPIFFGKNVKKRMRSGHSKAEIEEINQGGD